MQKTFACFLLLLPAIAGRGQTLGGSSVFNFLKFSSSPQLTALGGINISQQTNDISPSFHNPAMLRPEMHLQTQANFNSFGNGIRNYHLVSGYRSDRLQTNFSLGINFFNYGSIDQTDASGNIYGTIHPNDYVVQVAASRQYGSNWYYGAALKFIYSAYGPYRASGAAIDVGLNYIDTARLLQAGLVIKNMGLQLKAYNGTEKDDLPFDFQIGISKKLAKAPLQFSLTLHHLHQFDLRYEDTVFNNENGSSRTGNSFVDNLFRHVVFSAQFFISDKIEISAGYNYLRRQELNIGNAGNGLNGFSMGVGVLVRKLQIRYARTYYQAAQVNNQLGIGFTLSSFSSKHKK